MIGHLGHFCLEYFVQSCTQWTLRYILGPIWVIFDIYHFLMIPGPFECVQKMGAQKISFLNKGVIVTHLIDLDLGGQVPRLSHGPI